MKPKSFEWRRYFLFVCFASPVYVGAWALCCFHSLINPNLSLERALTASVDSCAEIPKECPFSVVTHSGRVWKKVPEPFAKFITA